MTMYRGIEVNHEGVLQDLMHAAIDYIYDTYEQRLWQAEYDNRVFNEVTQEFDEVPLTEEQLKAFHVQLLMNASPMGRGSAEWRLWNAATQDYTG